MRDLHGEPGAVRAWNWRDRALRSQLLRFAAELQTLAASVDDTLQLVSSEVWMADPAYYQSVREAAHRGRDGRMCTTT